MFDTDNFLDNETARLTASLVDSGGGLYERSSRLGETDAGKVGGSDLAFSDFVFLDSSKLREWAFVERCKHSSDADLSSPFRDSTRVADQSFATGAIQFAFGEVESGVRFPCQS